MWLAFAAATMAVVLNVLGMKLAGRVQVVVVVLVIAMVVICTVAAVPLIHYANLLPFNPKGFGAVISATVPIFFSFVGWEMVVPMAEEFGDPRRDLKRSLLIAAGFVGVMYLAFAFVTISTGVYRDGDGIDAFTTLANMSLGRWGLYSATFLACLVAYACLHINVAGFSRMLYSQARAGRLPRFLAFVSPATGAPIGALVATFGLFVLVFSAIAVFEPDFVFLVKWPRPSLSLPISLPLLPGTGCFEIAAGRLARGSDSYYVRSSSVRVACLFCFRLSSSQSDIQ